MTNPLQRITELEIELQQLKKEVQKQRWQATDIVPGTVVRAVGHSLCVIISCGYALGNETPNFHLGGLWGNPLEAYSTFPHGASAQEVADYLNERSFVKVGNLETNFGSF